MKIYPKDDKRRLYWLIELYLADEIDVKTFCDEVYYSYGQEIDAGTLNNVEKEAFKALYTVTDRFSPFESDFKLAPGVYKNENEVRDAALQAREILGEYFNLETQ